MTSAERRQRRYIRRRYRRETKRREVLDKYGSFYQVARRNSLAASAINATRNVKYKESVKRYSLKRLSKCAETSEHLLAGKDVRKGFISFQLTERGKQRNVMSVHFSERVPQKSLNTNALIPVLTRSLIYDNGASQKGRGTSFAMKRTVQYLRRYYRNYGNEGYVLCLDFKDYFGNMDHERCKQIVREAFEDEDIIRLTESFVDAYYEHNVKRAIRSGKDPGEIEHKGLGLGSEINQTLAICYASKLHHYITEVLRIRYFVVYMDDCWLVHPDKEYLEYCLEQIRRECTILKIVVNERKTYITKISHGFTFLKTRIKITDTGKILRRPVQKNISNERRKLRKQMGLVESEIMTADGLSNSYISWRSSLKNKQARRSVYMMDLLYRGFIAQRNFNIRCANAAD